MAKDTDWWIAASIRRNLSIGMSMLPGMRCCLPRGAEREGEGAEQRPQNGDQGGRGEGRG